MASFADYMNGYGEDEKKKKKKKKKASFADYMNGYGEEGKTDIAPVRKTTTTTTKKDDRTWFQTGAFDDGYDFGDVTKTILGTVTDVAENLGSGIAGMGEKIVDSLAMMGTTMSNAQMSQLSNDELAFSALKNIGKDKKTKNEEAESIVKKYGTAQKEAKKGATEFVKKDLYDEEKIAKKIISAPVKNLTGIDTEADSVFGEKTDALVQSGGQLLATAGLNAMGVPWFLTTGLTSYGAETENALNQGATFEQASMSAAISAGAEILTEKLSGGIKFGGKTLDDALIKPFTEKISSKVTKSLVNLGIDALGEGSEEVISSIFSNLGSALYKEESIGELFTSEEAVDEYIESFIGGAVLGGVSSGIGAVANRNRIELTENEQKVFDKVVEDRIAGEKADGTLTKKKESEIRKAVLNDMLKGYIDTDTVESVLGGETYKAYKDTVDNETALQKEFDTLNKMKQGEMTGEQLDRRAELKQQLEELKNNSKTSEMKSKLSENVYNLVKDSRLAESYNETARRGQTFQADLSKYDTKQQETIKKAIESGILNNTNRTHEFVDMIAKISADKGVPFDFVNNEKIKASGFAVEGKTVNGYKTDEGSIAINIQSSKSLDSVVGHEITHILEGTELYAELQNAIEEYATTKGEYETRMQSLREVYADVYKGEDFDAKIKAELTADIVGEYLFTDTDFINRLSTEKPNVFKKIYDEIKYLCKIATAGSKEARELERVKHQFEKAYRESSNTKGTQYSLSAEQEEYFKDSKVRDENGNLKVMYHGTSKGGHTVFDTFGESKFGLFGAGTYFTDNKDIAQSYTEKGKGSNKQVYEAYLNITNPIDMDAQADVDAWKKAFSDADYSDCVTNEDCFRAMKEVFVDEQYPQWEAKDTAMDVLQSMGYDGITHIGGGRVNADGTKHQVYIAFEPEQIKNIDNLAPTKDADIRYSLSEDSNGRKLSKEQQDYFKDSKAIDEKGNLKVVYHGTRNADFTVFKRNATYFTDSKEMADSYSPNGEMFEGYVNITKPYEIDAAGEKWSRIPIDNDTANFLKSYGSSVFKEDGKWRTTPADIASAIEEAVDNGEVDYDGIIIKNIDDTGSYYKDTDKHLATDYIVFNSNQFKNLSNTAPTTADDIRYSLSDPLENSGKLLYNSNSPLSIENRAKTVNNSSLNWVYKSEIFSVTENKLFHEKISEINQGSQAFEKNAIGEYMLPIENKIVFTDGNYDSPYVREIVEVLTEYQTEFEKVRERIYNVEKGKSSKQDAVRTFEQMFGKGFIVTYRSGNYGVYDWQNGQRKGKSRSTVIRNYLNKQFRRRNDRTSKETEVNEIAPINETSSEDGVFFDAPKTKYSLSDSDISSKNVYGFSVKQDADVDEDLLEELSIWHPDAQVDSDGNVTVYHRTSKANADKIRKTGVMTALEDALFFSSKSEGYASDYGDTVLTFKIPSTVLRVNDIFDGEVHFDVPLKRINNQWSMNVSKYLVDGTVNNHYSLSGEGKIFKDNGRFYGKDIMYQGEDIAPIEKTQATVSKTEQVEDVAPSVVEEIAPTEQVEEAETKPTRRSELHSNIMEGIKGKFAEKGFDFDEVLNKAKNLSTWSTVDNIPQRVMEKALGYKQGQILADETVNKVAQNESEGIKWLNSFTDRKNGILAQISRQYNIKPGSKKSAAAQMYAEGFYVNKNNEIIKYGDRELAIDFPDVKVQENIKGLANDPRIRQIYDETLEAINESRRRNLYPEIQRLDNYFLHFRAMEDTFSRLGLPFNPNDIRAKDLPTDLNGVTADLKPGQPYFASAMHREGIRTSFDLLGGLERYLSSAKNQIYHIDDIQTLRALRNYIADTYGQAKGLESLDELTDEEAQYRIEQVYNSHLSTFAKFLNEEANVLAGKTTLIDRGAEGIMGRRAFTFFDTLNKQVGSNMVGFNVSSSLTNFLPVAQTFAKTNKFDFTKAFAQTVSSKISSIFGKTDSFVENNPTIIRRKGAERFYRTPYQKMGDAGYVLMSAVDDISTELIVRTKYNELIRKGMDEQKASFEADKWVSRLMGDRSLGQQPQLFNSKVLGLVTKFQLEVRNQLDSQFYDTIQEAKVSNEEIENKLLRNAKTAAKVTSVFVQLAAVQHLYGMAFESIAGYNPAFDIIDVLIKTLGFDDDEEDEDTPLDNLEEGLFALAEDLPYASLLVGAGRIPISSALPIKQLWSGKDKYGNEKSRKETLIETAPYYLLPTGYGQLKKTTQGLGMFSDEHPTAGSYTDSGNLRFPVDDTLKNRVQAGIFGQYANENARTYFDEGYAPLKEKQIQEYIDVEMPIKDYWQYREDLKDLDTLEKKFDFIADMDLPVEKKNILINNIVDRKEEVDLENYDDFENYEEFDFYAKNTEKYNFLQDNGVSYKEYKSSEDAKENYDAVYSWWKNNPEKVTVSKAVTDNVIEYRGYASDLDDIRADKDSNGKSIVGSAKEKKKAYIWGLDIDEGAKYILFKNEYNADDTYNYDIIDYLNSRDDISYDEMNTILEELDFKVDRDTGYITWD